MSPGKWFVVLLFLFTTQHITVFSGLSVTSVFFVMMLPIMLIAKRARVDRLLAVLFSWAAIAALYSYFLSEEGGASFASAAYLLVLMMPFVLVDQGSGPSLLKTSKNFLLAFKSFMILSVFLGLGAVLLGDDFFSFRDLIPAEIRLEGFNTSNVWQFGDVWIYRSNGFFFLEPSLFSQYLAWAILMEMKTTRNMAVVGLLTFGMLTTFSGTGVVLLAAGLGLTAIRLGSVKSIVATVAPLLALVGIIIYFLPSLAERAAEVGESDRSGYWRFGMPVVVIFESYTSSIHNVLFGVGPGVAKNNLDTMLMAYSSGIGKVLYENGFVGACGIVALYYNFGMKSCHQRGLVLTVMVFILIVTCGVQDPIVLLTSFLFVFYAAPALGDADRRHRAAGKASVRGTGKDVQLSL